MPVVHHASYGGRIIRAEAVRPQLEEVHEDGDERDTPQRQLMPGRKAHPFPFLLYNVFRFSLNDSRYCISHTCLLLICYYALSLSAWSSPCSVTLGAALLRGSAAVRWRDRKSTRLNSSHQIISYAVFCLKKKNKRHHRTDSNIKPFNVLEDQMTSTEQAECLASYDRRISKYGGTHWTAHNKD